MVAGARGWRAAAVPYRSPITVRAELTKQPGDQRRERFDALRRSARGRAHRDLCRAERAPVRLQPESVPRERSRSSSRERSTAPRVQCVPAERVR